MSRHTATNQALDFRPTAERPVSSFSGGPPPTARPEPPVSNARLGMIMLIAAETMLFTGLIGAYVVFRFGHVSWPSARLYLPVGVTWVNTGVLLLSCYTMRRAMQAVRADDQHALVKFLAVTGALGTLFLGIQGYEWVELVRDGLTISASIYGATFYVLIGCHGTHVLAAVVWLLVVVWQARQGWFSAQRYVGIEICSMYWYYVGALWVILFGLVYLN